MHGGGFPTPSRFRLLGRQLGYTQTECGFREPWKITEEYAALMDVYESNQTKDAAEEEMMED